MRRIGEFRDSGIYRYLLSTATYFGDIFVISEKPSVLRRYLRGEITATPGIKARSKTGISPDGKRDLIRPRIRALAYTRLRRSRESLRVISSGRIRREDFFLRPLATTYTGSAPKIRRKTNNEGNVRRRELAVPTSATPLRRLLATARYRRVRAALARFVPLSRENGRTKTPGASEGASPARAISRAERPRRDETRRDETRRGEATLPQ